MPWRQFLPDQTCLVDHLDAYDEHIANLLRTRAALHGLIESSAT